MGSRARRGRKPLSILAIRSPPITSQQIKVAALSFSPSTAIGEDWLHPRAFAFLSEEVRSRYAELLNSAKQRALGLLLFPRT